MPDSFGFGISIPLIKDETGNLNDLDNYRAITLSCVICKLFEMAKLDICNDVLSTDPLQYGFNTGTGRTDAIFRLKTTVQHFVNKGSSVFLVSLDMSKAFDKVNHYKLFSALLTAGIPVAIIDVLCDWYSKLHSAVRWNNVILNSFIPMTLY